MPSVPWFKDMWDKRENVRTVKKLKHDVGPRTPQLSGLGARGHLPRPSPLWGNEMR